MAQNIKINGVTYNSVSSLSIPLDAGGDNAVFPDTSDATAKAGDIAEGKTAYVGGLKVTGTASGGEPIVGATNMASMFQGSVETTLDLRLLDTSKVTDMGYMFSGSAATTLDLSSFDTSNVTNMSYMFSGSAATTLDLSSFDTSNVTDMSYMFYGSQATTGYARTQADADKFNASTGKPAGLTFVDKTIDIPFTITVFAGMFGGGGGGGGGGGDTDVRSAGQITLNGDEVFVWNILSGLSTATYASALWNDHLMTDFYNETDGIITSEQQDGISNIFTTGFDEGFEVGVYEHFDSIYIYDVPSTVSSGSVTLGKVESHTNNEITVTGVFIV